MSGASKVGVSVAGGTVSGPGAEGTVFVDGVPLSLVGDLIAPHGTGTHSSAEMASGSTAVFADGIPACREGDLASCLHPVTLGSTSMFINS